MTDRQEEHRNDLLNDPAFLRGLTMRRMSRRDLFRSAGVGAGALSIGGHPGRVRRDQRRRLGGGGGGGSTGGGRRHRLERRAERQAELRELAALHRQEEGQRPGDVSVARAVHHGHGHRRDLPGGDQLEPGVLRQDPAAAGRGSVDRLGHHRHHERRHAQPVARLNYLVPLPTDKRPNFDANASVAVKDPAYDPGNKFTMAWQSGLTGIGWDPVQVKALRPDKPTITSVMDLFDPAFKGKVGMFADNADLPGLVMVGMGVAPETSTPGRLAGGRRPAAEAEGRRDRPAVLHAELHERARRTATSR